MNQSQLNDVMFNQCEHSVDTLAKLTNPMTEPWFVELSGVIEGKMLTITVIMNLWIVSNKNKINHYNYKLFINGKWYSNQNRKHGLPGILLLFYSIPISKMDLRKVHLTIRDNKNGIEYKNLPICIRREQKPVDMGICTHVSKFNSIAEISSWVTYHLARGMDKIIIMICTPYPELYELFDEEIKNGKVVLVHFEWPIQMREFYQRQYQVASMTTCFHRYRRSVKTLFFVDVDEYIHSVSNPFNFKPVLSSLRKQGYVHANVLLL